MTSAEFKEFLTKDDDATMDDELNADGIVVRDKVCCDKNAALWFAHLWAQANGETY